MNVTTHTAATPGADITTRSLRERIRARLRARSEEGQSLLEFALCAPILLIVVTGISTFGFTLNNYLVMTNAVGGSVQNLAMSRGNTLDPCHDTASAFVNASPTLNSSKLKFTYVLNGTTYGQYTGLSASTCSSSSTTSGAAGNLKEGQPVQLTVSYPCSLSVYGSNLLPNCNLLVQTTEIVQ